MRKLILSEFVTLDGVIQVRRILGTKADRSSKPCASAFSVLD